MATSEEGQVSHVPGRGRQGGGSFPSPRLQPVGQDSPVHQSGAASSGQNTELSVSDASSWALNGIKNDKEGKFKSEVGLVLKYWKYFGVCKDR